MSEPIEITDPIIGYCVSCKERRELSEPKAEWTSTGTPSIRATCSVCGSGVYKMGKTHLHDGLEKPAPTPRKKKPAKAVKGKKRSTKSRKKPAAKPIRRSGNLVIVESPAKARTIERYLGPGFKVRSSFGHIRDLLKSRMSVDVDNEFEPSYRVPNDKKKVVKELIKAGQSAKTIYLATDPDREGEAIAWHIMEAAEFDQERTHRVVFNEITKSAVTKAIAEPGELNMDLVDAQQARRILDRLVGFSLSPLVSRKIRNRAWGLSAGRVQSVAVRLVVDREREITGFEPQEFWLLDADLSKSPTSALFRASLNKINGKKADVKSRDRMDAIVATLEKSRWTTEKSTTKNRLSRASGPFTTSTLQQTASSALGFRPSRTMRVAQQLYSGINIGAEGRTGLITYMRTDSLRVATPALTSARKLIASKFGDRYVPEKPNFYKTRSKSAQDAHEAIRPTDPYRTPEKVAKSLSAEQLRLYRLIWQRFIASQMAPAISKVTSVDINAEESSTTGKPERFLFRAVGSVQIFDGYKIVYKSKKKSVKQSKSKENQVVPADLVKGDIVSLRKLLPEQKFTNPPARFTEASLVRELEKLGIGRPSTYASILSTIRDRGYVEETDRKLTPTEVGEVVNDLLVEFFPEELSVDFTADMEARLDEIADGKPWVPVLDGFYRPFAERLAIATVAEPTKTLIQEPEPVGRECPLCSNELMYKSSRYGRFIGCSDFPNCKHTENVLDTIGIECPLDGGDLAKRKTRKGRVFYSCSNYPTCEFSSWSLPTKHKCAKCSGMLVESGKKNLVCLDCATKYDKKEIWDHVHAP